MAVMHLLPPIWSPKNHWFSHYMSSKLEKVSAGNMDVCISWHNIYYYIYTHNTYMLSGLVMCMCVPHKPEKNNKKTFETSCFLNTKKACPESLKFHSPKKSRSTDFQQAQTIPTFFSASTSGPFHNAKKTWPNGTRKGGLGLRMTPGAPSLP